MEDRSFSKRFSSPIRRNYKSELENKVIEEVNENIAESTLNRSGSNKKLENFVDKTEGPDDGLGKKIHSTNEIIDTIKEENIEEDEQTNSKFVANFDCDFPKCDELESPPLKSLKFRKTIDAISMYEGGIINEVNENEESNIA